MGVFKVSTGLVQLAIRVASIIHEATPLYKSSRAIIQYGRGGGDGVDYSAYSKRYRYPARWKNAGVRVERVNKKTWIIIENYLGKEVCRIQSTRKLRYLKEITFEDLYQVDK